MKLLFFLTICVIVGMSFAGYTCSDKTSTGSTNQVVSDGTYTYSGNNYANTPKFNLEKGPVTFELTMSGQYYNGAILYDSKYVYINGLVDQTKPGTITKTVDIRSPGEYFIGMNAQQGPWKVKITQESTPVNETKAAEKTQTQKTVTNTIENQTTPDGTYSYSGKGYANTPKFNLKSGPATFELTMSGPYYNGAILYDNKYVYVSGLVDQATSGTITKKIEISNPGEYFIGMNAPQGSWTVKISQ